MFFGGVHVRVRPRVVRQPHSALPSRAALSPAPVQEEAQGTTVQPSPGGILPHAAQQHAPRRDTLRTPSRVANVEMLFAASPSTSGRSLVMAMTVAKSVTNAVMNLHTP
jgi:hypothetical protein